jgi:hypothetical protein
MATLDMQSATLVPTVNGIPLIMAEGGDSAGITFRSSRISATGTATLRGTVGESLTDWTIGFVQLKFIGTDYCRYRGRFDRDGSVLVTKNNQILCRDTDETGPEVWYDPLWWGIQDGRGTQRLTAATTIPASGELTLTAGLDDTPGRFHDASRVNTLTRTDNFLRHSDIALHFCTMLVVQDPRRRYYPLRHFYWNIRFESMFEPQPSGVPLIGDTPHQELNIQRKVHSGLANDIRFRGREFDMAIPVSNDISRRPARIIEARDWRHM